MARRSKSLIKSLDSFFDQIIKSKFIELFGDFTKNQSIYEIVPINSLCKNKSSSIQINKLEDNNGPYPLYGASGMVKNIDFFEMSSEYIGIVKDGAGVGRVMRLPKNSSLVGTMSYICPDERCDIIYLEYILKILNLGNDQNGSTIPHIYFKDYSKKLIPLAPLQKQIQFSTFVRQIDKIYLLFKKIAVDCENYLNSKFLDMFGDPIINSKGWNVCSLKDLTVVLRNGHSISNTIEEYVDDGVVFLQSQNVWRNHFEMDGVLKISQELHEKFNDTQLKKRDLLITKTGRIETENSSLGRISIFDGEDGSANISSEIYLVRLDNDKVVPEFVLYLLLSDSYRKYIRHCCPGGTDKRHLYLKDVEKFPIILPPIEKQLEFIDDVNVIKSIKDNIVDVCEHILSDLNK